jgi:Methyltransferase domain
MSSLRDSSHDPLRRSASTAAGHSAGTAPRPCVACGSNLADTVLDGTRYQACPACGTAHSAEPLDDCQDGYYFHDGHAASAPRLKQVLQDLTTHGLDPRGCDGGRLLVFAAGSGECFPVAAEHGLEATGFECSRALVRRAQHRGEALRLFWVAGFNLLVLGRGPASEYARPVSPGPLTSPSDRLWLPDLIEHYEDPRDVLAPAQGLLRPGGLLFGSTLTSAAGLDQPQYHRQRYTPAGLSACLRRCGFTQARFWHQQSETGPRLAFAAHRD